MTPRVTPDKDPVAPLLGAVALALCAGLVQGPDGPRWVLAVGAVCFAVAAGYRMWRLLGEDDAMVAPPEPPPPPPAPPRPVGGLVLSPKYQLAIDQARLARVQAEKLQRELDGDALLVRREMVGWLKLKHLEWARGAGGPGQDFNDWVDEEAKASWPGL